MLWWIMSFPCLASAIAYFFRIMKKLNASSRNDAILHSKKEKLDLKDEPTI
jgi:hypothetical protein